MTRICFFFWKNGFVSQFESAWKEFNPTKKREKRKKSQKQERLRGSMSRQKNETFKQKSPIKEREREKKRRLFFSLSKVCQDKRMRHSRMRHKKHMH